jgi:hypothetical protein
MTMMMKNSLKWNLDVAKACEEGKEYSSHNKTKEGQLDWAHIAQELPYKTHY